ncbi:hypothetical protein [Streptomyces sp. Li-HN-5-11]|uniref:hypothetical protein n=1 Tax=Streptomyces sp. Li-HN-5-11 TaxID=3075432 RepID=UPI0037D9CCAD
MTDKQRNAPARPKTRHSSGVTHVNEPHHDNFVVIGNHLAQHPELSLTAIGLATHIQSLPEGTPIGIKALAAKFRPPSVTPPRPDHLQTCDSCDRAFRSPQLGRCRDCRSSVAVA